MRLDLRGSSAVESWIRSPLIIMSSCLTDLTDFTSILSVFHIQYALELNVSVRVDHRRSMKELLKTWRKMNEID